MMTMQQHTAVQSTPGRDGAAMAQPHERGRKHRSRADASTRPVSSRSPEAEEPAMGQSGSKARDGSRAKPKSKSPAKSRSGQVPSLDTATVDRHGSICQSPTWSPRGSLAARRQVEKDKREQQRQQRKEADENRKRLKEEEQKRKPLLASDSTRRPGRRLTKQPPPAAMETQRMPTALRAEGPADDGKAQRRRSSSLSSVIRMVTGIRSSSKARNRDPADEEAYMSDASTKSKTSFIGGIKLRDATTTTTVKEFSQDGQPVRVEQNVRAEQAPRIELGPKIDESTIRRDSIDFGAQMQAQMDSITHRASLEAAVQESPNVVSQRAFRQPKTASLPAHVRQSSSSLPEPRDKAQPDSVYASSIQQDAHFSGAPVSEPKAPPPTSRLSKMGSVREASINRMQNLVIPLRSAMKGGRQTAGKGRVSSMPTWNNQSPDQRPGAATQSQPVLSDYVRRARMRDQSRSMAGWEDEMAVKTANELAALEAAAKESASPQAAFGPQMPPTPEASIDNLPQPAKELGKSTGLAPVEAPVSDANNLQAESIHSAPTSPITPGDADQIVWKQPIKANKKAAATRVEAHRESKAAKNNPPTDIDTLPSQQPRRPSVSQALKPSIPSSVLNKQLPPEPTHELITSLPKGGDSPPADLQDYGLRRQPAVMSWKIEKDKNGKVLSSSPRSPASPTFSTVDHVIPPEQHPSLAALRASPGTIQSSRSEATLRVPNTDVHSNGEIGSHIERPFSIVPTPVASPIPGDLISMAMTRPVKTPVPVRRHSTPIEAIEEARVGPKEDKDAKAAVVFPFPDRHVTLRKPERRETDKADSLKQDSDKSDREGSGSSSKPASGKVTFHTPPESPRYLATTTTSYDAYRRPYSKTSPNLKSLEDDQLELPVPATDLGKPNPPFAQEGKHQRSSGRRSRESSSSPKRNSRRGSDGYVYLPFSPAASSSNLQQASKPRGFKLKSADGANNLEMAAKVFVICCGCKKWHDIPSSIYREMSKGVRQIDPKQDGVAEARLPSNGRERSSSRDAPSKGEKKTSGVLTTVPCPWCKHPMSTLCCECWTTVCYKYSQHHAVDRKDEIESLATKTISPRVKTSKRRE